MSVPTFADFTYPGADHPRGVIESGLDPAVVAAIHRRAQAMMAALGLRIGDCLVASTAWHGALSACGQPSITFGGVGQHVDTVPPTPSGRRGGYLTDDDGVVAHWWLMFGPEGLLFDPTVH